MMNRTLAIFAAGIGAFALTACGGADSASGRTQFERENDIAKGSAEAPVTMIEYASVACGGCAAWHESAYPVVQEYIESGDVRFVFREMITGQPQLAIAGFMLAECAPDDRYFDVIDVLFEQQRALFTAMQRGQARDQFESIARSAGLSDDEFRQCMQNEEVLQQVRAASEQASADGIGSTPTFILNGQQLETVSAPSGGGQVWAVNGDPLADASGPIPADFAGETFERIILYFKARAEGRDPAEGAPAATEEAAEPAAATEAATGAATEATEAEAPAEGAETGETAPAQGAEGETSEPAGETAEGSEAANGGEAGDAEGETGDAPAETEATEDEDGAENAPQDGGAG
ncbi:MAG: DsbA family protein [Oceanicaulis sp.]